MATTYEYSTGKLTRDWHFVEIGTPCKGSGLPCIVGNERCRKSCLHFKGLFQWCVKCGHPDKSDTENAPIHDFYEEFQEEALTHMYD